MAQKCPFLRPENGEEKVLPDLGFFRSSIFVTARFCGGFWATNSVICIGCVFAGSGCAFLYRFSYLLQGVLVSCRSRETGAAVSGFVFSSLLFLLLLPPFFLGAGLGSLSLLCSCRQDRIAWSRQVRLSICFVCVLSLLSFLSPRVGSPLPCSFSFFPSLSLFRNFLSLLHAVQNCRAGMDLALG